jgi:hypothetical protein
VKTAIDLCSKAGSSDSILLGVRVSRPKSTILPLLELPLHRELKRNKGNPHPNTVGLKRGGRKKGSGRQITSQQEDIFCLLLKLGRGKSAKAAAIGAGFAPSAAYSLLRQPRIQERLALIDEKLSEEAREYLAAEYALEVCLCDENAARIMCVEKPHKFRGFADQVKMIEAGWKRLKLIDPPRLVNNATACSVAAGSTMAEIYKSKWLRDKEAKLAADLEAEHASKQLK